MPVSPLFRCTILSMLFAFASQSLMAGSSGLEWQRINISYNGLVVRHSVIATYGSSGAYTLSTNDGATWQRKQLSTEDDRILAMSASSKGWAAITGNGFLFRTENVAGAWTKTAHGVQNAISVAMLNSGGCIVVSKNAVYRIGSAGMATDSLRFRADSINTIAYHPDRPLLYAADVSGTLETIDMETLTRIRTTDFTALGFCSPCTTLNYVFATADTLFAQTDSQLFRSVNGGETWNIQNSSILQNVGRGIINSNGDVRFVRTTFINPN
ncbi:MAG: hypothetical protein JNL32_15890, partial [Candidatus Kapabacteria bacterium]|nr:hypothetical protein [Candidatus Kapabacteria bacterium]